MNIQTLAIELYKVSNGRSPTIMNMVFPLNSQVRYPCVTDFKTFNVKTTSYRHELLGYLGPKIWSIVPSDMILF